MSKMSKKVYHRFHCVKSPLADKKIAISLVHGLVKKNMGHSNKGRKYSGLKSSLSTANGNNMEMETNMLRLHRTSR